MLAQTLRAATASECPTGGFIVETGFDENGNGRLDDAEINGGAPVCNGDDGRDGADGARGPAGAEGPRGPQGQRGTEISQVDVRMLPPGSTATASLAAIASDPEGDQRLSLELPQTPPVVPPQAARVVGTSWAHDRSYGLGELPDFGLALGFSRQVQTAQLSTLPVLALERFDNGAWVNVPSQVQSLSDFIVDQTLITEVSVASGTPELANGVTLVPNSTLVAGFYRVHLRGNHVLDSEGSAVDAELLGGTLPSGNGLEGGVFTSWFEVQ